MTRPIPMAGRWSTKEKRLSEYSPDLSTEQQHLQKATTRIGRLMLEGFYRDGNTADETLITSQHVCGLRPILAHLGNFR
jgi:hypothetical protein